MGGFFDFQGGMALDKLNPDSYPEIFETDTPRSPLVGDTNLDTPATPEPKPRILISESEILDKSKNDSLGKLTAAMQTFWFIVQYLQRWASHRPQTQLEVMTLAYAVLNLLIYALWWDKPLDVKEPIYVNGRTSAIIYGRKGLDGVWSILSDTLKSFPKGMNNLDGSDVWVIGTLFLVGILFGGVHCLAWHFNFPTGTEEMLWKVSAIYCTAYPAALMLVISAIPQPDDTADHEMTKMIRSIPVILVFSSLVLYVVCRVILLVLTFTCLRGLPMDVYKITPWTSYLPHFG